jgi:hypothetical protein
VNNENGLSLESSQVKNNAVKLSKEDVLEHFKDNCNQSQLLAHFREKGLVFTTENMIKLIKSIPEIQSARGANNSLIYYRVN